VFHGFLTSFFYFFIFYCKILVFFLIILFTLIGVVWLCYSSNYSNPKFKPYVLSCFPTDTIQFFLSKITSNKRLKIMIFFFFFFFFLCGGCAGLRFVLGDTPVNFVPYCSFYFLWGFVVLRHIFYRLPWHSTTTSFNYQLCAKGHFISLAC
jgi:hypothetical protein